MPARSLAFTVAVALLCLFLAALAVPAIPAITNPEPSRVSPFAAAGLLSRPDESAEELLLRAHTLEARAIALVSVGYTHGVGGFPLDHSLGLAWARYLMYVGDLETSSLLSISLWAEYGHLYKDFGLKLATCASARKSPLAEPLKKAGIIDIEPACDALEKEKAAAAGWEQALKQAQDMAALLQRKAKAVASTMRELRGRPATPQEKEDLYEIRDTVPEELLLFYAATTHDPVAGVPDWNAERLLSFSIAQKAQKPKDNARPSEAESFFASLVEGAPRTVVRYLRETPEQALPLVRAAHTAPPDSSSPAAVEAIRTMALYYRDGTLGFPKNDVLAGRWVRFAALENDGDSMVLASLDAYSKKDFATAWAWASIAWEAKTASEQSKAMAEQMMRLAETVGGKNIRSQGEALVPLRRKEMQERLDWRTKMQTTR